MSLLTVQVVVLLSHRCSLLLLLLLLLPPPPPPPPVRIPPSGAECSNRGRAPLATGG